MPQRRIGPALEGRQCDRGHPARVKGDERYAVDGVAPNPAEAIETREERMEIALDAEMPPGEHHGLMAMPISADVPLARACRLQIEIRRDTFFEMMDERAIAHIEAEQNDVAVEVEQTA